MSSQLKKELLDHCLLLLDNKISILQSEFKIYMDSAANETKSTAGDKHDTSRSMMQMEQEKMGAQLRDLLNQKKVLLSIPNMVEGKTMKLGSIVFTNSGNFFLSIFSKPISIGTDLFFPVSLQSPIGKILLNSKLGQTLELNGKQYSIIEISY